MSYFRKFLVINETWMDFLLESNVVVNHYLTAKKGTLFCVQVFGPQATLIIKDENVNLSVELPYLDAQNLAVSAETTVSKIRHKIKYDDTIWYIDEYLGPRQNLNISEILFEDKSTSAVRFPPWIGEEVTHNPNYFEKSLAI